MGRKGRISLPDPFIDRMRDLLGDDVDAFLASFGEPVHSGLRVNTLKVGVGDLLRLYPGEGPLVPVPWAPTGFYYDQADKPSKHPYYHAGLYYLQEPSAMAPGAIADARPGERVLDICAAPGGKSTQLAAGLAGSGVLVSNDIDADRAKALTKNIELLGVDNAVVMNENPRNLASAFPSWFDKVVVDAPCSGEGMFRKDPQAARSWESFGCLRCAGMQREILWYAASMVKPGGRIIYSTCTFAPEEDEQAIDWFLDSFPGWYVGEIPMAQGFSPGNPAWGSGRDELARTVRLWPHRLKGEGHFVAVLVKGASAPDPGQVFPADSRDVGQSQEQARQRGRGRRPQAGPAPRQAMVVQEVPGELQGFSDRFLTESGRDRILGRTPVVKGSNTYLLPRDADGILTRAVSTLNCPRPGWFVGVTEKGRFEPSTAMATALRMEDAVNSFNLPSDSRECLRYLKGETLPAMDDRTGWSLVGTDGFSLGWAKQVGGILKNHYPIWWRWNG